MEEDIFRTKLSLEPPYKNDDGELIPVTFDIGPDGEYIYEPVQTASEKLSDDVRRIFFERGHDFFHKAPSERKRLDEIQKAKDEKPSEEEVDKTSPMTVDELRAWREELLGDLSAAHFEMLWTKELMSLLLSSAAAASGSTPGFNVTALAQSQSQPQPSQSNVPEENRPLPERLPPEFLSASRIDPQPQPEPLKTFDTLVTVSEKDESLRNAAAIFRNAASTVERSHVAGESYWLEALKLRRQNWALIPAPLPLGAPTGRAADKTSKDFLIFHGLSESPGVFKQRALGYLPTQDATDVSADDRPAVSLPQQRNLSLRISLTTTDASGTRTTTHSARRPAPAADDAGALLAEAQARVIEQEIFAVLIRDAGALSYASSRVSERLIELEAAQDVLLRAELLEDSAPAPSAPPDPLCDLVLALLPLLLLRAHAQHRARRLRPRGDAAPGAPTRLLHPVVDVLQYAAFVRRVRGELGAVVHTLRRAGVRTKFAFRAVGAGGAQMIEGVLDAGGAHPPISGDAAIRIEDGRALRFSLSAPSTLVAHLPQATLTVSSLPQLTQLLRDETEQALLERICAIGTELTEDVGGAWFVDSLAGRAVGKWEGCLLNFKIALAEDSTIRCASSRMHRAGGRAETTTSLYVSGSGADDGILFTWLRKMLLEALAK